MSKLDTYPLPKIDDIFAQLLGGQKFTKLDLAHVYQQLALYDDSKQYTTINTHKGLHCYNCHPFDLHLPSSKGPWILKGIPYISVYIDDILVTGEADEKHLKNLDEVFT